MDDSLIQPTNIKNLIHVIRGQEVILDGDLAKLYGYEVKNLNRQVKNNIQRFPKDFCFQLTEEEFLRCNFCTAKINSKSRYLPYVFTEQGVYMLATVLRGELAEKQSIAIMRAFKEMRHFISNNAPIIERLNAVEERQIAFQIETNKKFDQVFSYMDERKEPEHKIFFNNSFYDAFSFLAKIIAQANQETILIDNYINNVTLDLLSKKRKGVDAKIYTVSLNNHLAVSDVNAFNLQYPTLEVHDLRTFHDRFLILDRKKAYHVGASLKDAGKRIFGVDLIDDRAIVATLLASLKK